MASSPTSRSIIAAPARPRLTDPNLPDFGAAIIVMNDSGQKILANGGREYGHSSRKHGYDHFRCTACIQRARQFGWTEGHIRVRVVTIKVSGLDTDNPRLRSDLNHVRHLCAPGYMPASRKRRATMDADDRLEKSRPQKPGEHVDEPEIFGQTVPTMDGSYGYWLEERAIMLRYKENGKVPAEIPGAKEVYCVRCSELNPLHHSRAVISGGNFVLFHPAKGNGDNVHICLEEARERNHVPQPVASQWTVQEFDCAPLSAESEHQGPNQLAADVSYAPMDDSDALVNEILTNGGADEPSPLTHASPIVRPAETGGSSIAGSRTILAARFDDDVIVLDSGDEDEPTDAASLARIKNELLDTANALTASVEFMQGPVSSPHMSRTSAATNAEPVRGVKPPRAIPVQRPSGVPKVYKNRAFGKVEFIVETSQIYAVYKQGLDGVHHKFKKLWTGFESLEGESFEVGIYECYDCELFLAKEGSTAAIGQVKVANGYFVDSHPRLPERIPHCCKPAPQ